MAKRSRISLVDYSTPQICHTESEVSLTWHGWTARLRNAGGLNRSCDFQGARVSCTWLQYETATRPHLASGSNLAIADTDQAHTEWEPSWKYMNQDHHIRAEEDSRCKCSVYVSDLHHIRLIFENEQILLKHQPLRNCSPETEE